jgi:hypothetical protein
MWVAPGINGPSVLRVISRYLEAWSEQTFWVLLALAFFFVARSVWLLRPLASVRTGQVAAACIAAIAVGWALHLGWVADDAFISFRYVRNWVEGSGLVFNAGQRVEGYTNFLWVVLLSPFEALGAPLPLVSVALTLSCLVLTLLLTASFTQHLWAQTRGAAGTRRYFPIASALLGLNYVFASFGTSGLETMFGTLLVLCAVERAERGAPLASGTFAILATLAHPDHAIFYACLALTYVLPARRLRELGWFVLPFALIYAPYFAWRWSYYGDFFPNTYYAKNAYLWYFSQGARYLALSGMSSGLWAALPLCVYGMLRWRRLRMARFCALAIPSFLLYIGKIGGDFMLGRLLCPLLPLVYIMAELGLRALLQEESARLKRWGSLALAVFCTAAVPVRFIKERENYAHVADERTFYPIASYVPFELDNAYWHWAHAFNRTFRQLSHEPTLAMFSVGIVGYETGLPLVDNAGLNHRELAHWQTRHRGRPGHEKLISPALLVQSDAQLSDVAVYPEPYLSQGRVNVDGVNFHMVRYDARLFEELLSAGVAAPTLLRYIDEYEPASTPERLSCDLWHMWQIYFRHNPGSSRRAAVVDKLLAEHPEWADYSDFMLPVTAPDAAHWARVSGLHFDLPDPNAELRGTAFGNNPTAREAPGQHPMAGVRGAFINSFQTADGNQATGSYTSAPFRIEGELITVQIGGGHFPDAVYAELLVRGERQFHATGCNSGIMGQRLWITRALRGELAQLRIVDRRRRDSGHIVVDELAQWQRRNRFVADTLIEPLDASHRSSD